MLTPRERPTIGLTRGPRLPAEQERRAEEAMGWYQRALEAAGAETILLSPETGVEPALARAQAILLTGGGDLDPQHYGQAPHPKLARVEPARDAFELGLASLARAQGVPLLGICRGAQVIGVAGGGRLLQDIPSQVAGACQHRANEVGRPACHEVRIAGGGTLRAIVGVDAMRVNSYHHQANDALGSGTRAVAWSPDGMVEAVEGEGASFLLGVQWHAERMPEDAIQARIFAALVAAARAAGARVR